MSFVNKPIACLQSPVSFEVVLFKEGVTCIQKAQKETYCMKISAKHKAQSSKKQLAKATSQAIICTCCLAAKVQLKQWRLIVWLSLFTALCGGESAKS